MMVKKKKEGYVIKEEEREAGTLLAAGAKQDKELIKQFKKVAALEGLKPSEAAIDAIRLWIQSQNLKDIDPKALIAAIYLMNYMREQVIKEFLALREVLLTFKEQLALTKEMISLNFEIEKMIKGGE